MAARRCTLCNINYPAVAQFAKCPLHEEETQAVNAAPDPNWQDALAKLKAQYDHANELARVIPLVHEVEPFVEHGQLWIKQSDLIDHGLRLSRFVSFHLFELDDGFIYEAQGFDDPRRAWWVERVAEAVPVADT